MSEPTIESLKREVAEWASRARAVREEERRAADVENRQLRAQLEAERGWRDSILDRWAEFSAVMARPIVINMTCAKCGYADRSGT